MSRYSGSSSGNAARSSSDSKVTLDVDVAKYMRTLEASGRDLSSLHRSGLTSTGSILPPGSLLPPGALGMAPMGGLGLPVHNNNLCLPGNPRSFMHRIIPPPQMGGLLPSRSLEMDTILRQLLLKQQMRSNPFQAPPLLQHDTIRGGYLPSSSSSSLRGSINIPTVNDFSTQELIHELSRRRSERSMESDLLNGMGPATLTMLSAEQISKTRPMNGLQSHGSDDSSHVNVDLANLSRMQSATMRGSGASQDSLDLLAATANIDAIRVKVGKEISKTNPTQRSVAGTTSLVPTSFETSKNRAKKRTKDKDAQADVSDVSDDEAPKSKRKKAKRAPSASSFDVLLTALGDDLHDLEENEDKARRRLSRESFFSNISDEQPPSDLIFQPVTQTQDDLLRKRQQSRLATLLDARPSLPTNSNAMIYPAPGQNYFDYTGRMPTSNSMMASLESVMIRNDFAMRELALRDMHARQEFTSRMVHDNLLGSLDSPVVKLPEKLPSPSSRNVSISDCDKPTGDKEERDKAPITPMKETATPIEKKEEGGELDKIPPKEALELFLSAHGEKGETLQKAMLRAITETEGSLASIHSWDRSQGLRKCHSRTVVKTRRSRAQIKAFLNGVEPPKEPHKNRKRSKKSKSKTVAHVFGQPAWRLGPTP